MKLGESIAVGAHQVMRREHDLLIFSVVGDVALPEVDGILAQERALRAEVGYSLVLVDAHRMGTMPAPIRKHAAEVMRADASYRGALAVWGAPFVIRTLINLILRATALLSRQARQPVEYFASQSDGLRWLQTQRQTFQVAASIRGGVGSL